jgi:hypothetical protein
MRSIAHACLIVALAALLGTGALASSVAAQSGRARGGQNAPNGGDKESSEYRQLVQQALDEFQRGNWDEAAGLFAQAHRLSPSARTLRGMGLAAFEGRRYVDALRDLRAALESTVNPLTAEQRAEVTETVSRAEHYVVQLELTVEPSSAEVRINGAIQPDQEGPRVLTVDPGMLELRASAPGYEPEVRQVRMVSGVPQQVALRLSPLSEGSAAGISIGGRPPSGEQRRHGPPYQTLAWLSVGLSAAGGIAAIVSWRVREGAAADFNDAECMQEDEKREEVCADALARVDSAETAAIVSGIAGGAFLTAAVVFFVLDGTSGDVETATPCGAGPGDVGVSCKLRF